MLHNKNMQCFTDVFLLFVCMLVFNEAWQVLRKEKINKYSGDEINIYTRERHQAIFIFHSCSINVAYLIHS